LRLDEDVDCATGTGHIHIGTADVEKLHFWYSGSLIPPNYLSAMLMDPWTPAEYLMNWLPLAGSKFVCYEERDWGYLRLYLLKWCLGIQRSITQL